MPFDNERIAKAVLAKLQSDLAAALDVVEAAWSASDPISLPDVVTWYYGHKPTVLDLESTDFPFVSTIPTSRRPLTAVYGWGYQDQAPQIYVDWFVVADDETTADKICGRYGEAILAVIQGQRAYGGYDQANYEPNIDLSESSRHPKTVDADMFNADQVDFIKMGRMTLEFGGSGKSGF